jgi:ABC-2 type transport system ATP-binding protein
MSYAIETHDLTKTYPHTSQPALNSLNIHIEKGEVYGFLGPNGAGKSTTIRTLLNFIQPTNGSATILGYDIVKDSVEIKKHLGYLAGEIALPRNMVGHQFLSYMASLLALKNKKYLTDLIKRFDVELTKPIRTLSKGNRQKIGLIQAFMHQPEVLILDEPTSGLDPLMQEEFFKLIKESKDRGAAIFVSSHNFSEVQRICDRVGFIRNGILIAQQELEQLTAKASHTFILTFGDKIPLKELQNLAGVQVTLNDESHVTISIEGELSPLFAILAKHKVTHLQQQEVNLEQQFLHLYSKGDK